MTEEVKNDEVIEETTHDEVVNEEIVEETLDEAEMPKAKGMAKGKEPEGAVSEPESIASVDKAADATKPKQAPAPKTKAGMISAMFDKMNKMSKADMEGMYSQYHKESVEMEEDETIAEPVIDTTAELDALVESEATLSDEFKTKTAVIFEAAVKSKLSEEVDRLEEQYKEELEAEVTATKSELVEKVDNYLNYVVETWMEDNKVAVQNGLRTEIAESFMDKLKDLFTESYIDVPESKVDLVDELSDQVDELEGKLNESTQKIIDATGELEGFKRDAIIREASKDLADTQVEKLKSLVDGFDFDDDFASKVETVKESHFSKKETSSEEVLEEGVDAEDTTTVETSESMDRYLQAIRKTARRA